SSERRLRGFLKPLRRLRLTNLLRVTFTRILRRTSTDVDGRMNYRTQPHANILYYPKSPHTKILGPMQTEMSEMAKNNPLDYAKGFEKGRKCYQQCIPLPRFNQYPEDPDRQIAYAEGLMDGYEEEQNSDCTTNFIYPKND